MALGGRPCPPRSLHPTHYYYSGLQLASIAQQAQQRVQRPGKPGKREGAGMLPPGATTAAACERHRVRLQCMAALVQPALCNTCRCSPEGLRVITCNLADTPGCT